jgi:hypothetical protein
MNDYIFFDPGLRDRFVALLAGRGLTGAVRPDPIEGFVVAVRDDLDDDLQETIEAEYDALMDEQQDLIDAEDAEDQHALMGVTGTLADGRSVDLRIPAALGRRLCATFTTEEIHELVSCIAQGTLDPVEGPLCCRKPLDNPFG